MDNKKLEELKAIEKEVLNNRKNRGPIWNTIKTLRGKEELSDFITFESIPLYPLLKKTNGEYYLTILLATLKDKETLHKPWGWVSFSYPELELKGKGKVPADQIPSDLTLSHKMICTKKYADLLQGAIDNNEKLPMPPKELIPIYKEVYNHKKAEEKPSISQQNDKNHTELHDRNFSINSNLKRTLKIKNELKDILMDYGNENLLNEYLRISKKINQPHFSIAVVGEFNRGKSTFINNLLDIDIIPTGTLPTTAMLTKIIYGPERKLYRIRDNQKTRISLTEWKDLTADEDGNDPEGVLVLELPNKFLKETGIKIIDTPGAGDLIGERAQITSEVIASCDATIIAIDATMPVSLTEKSFIEDNILLKRIPRVSMLITKMDQVEDKERESVYNHIKNSAKNLSDDISVWVANDRIKEVKENLTQGIDDILIEIEQWSKSSENKKIRFKQVQLQYYDLIEQFMSLLDSKLDLLSNSEEERKKKIKDEKFRIKKESRFWKDLQLELESKKIDFSNWLSKKISPYKSEMIEDFQIMVENSGDPKKWVEKFLPYYLKKEILKLINRFDSEIERLISSNIQWIAKEIQQKYEEEFDMKLNKLNLRDKLKSNIKDDIRDLDSDSMKDLTKSKNITDMAILITRPLLFAFGKGGIAILGGAIGRLVSQKIFKGKFVSQKQKVKQQIPEIIDEIFAKIPLVLEKKVAKIYGSIINNLKNRAKAWNKNQLMELEKEFSKDTNKEIAKYKKYKSRISNIVNYIKN